jgi:hypothetical protein
LSPWLDSPTTWEEVIQSVSKNLRSQWRRAGRALERQGAVAFRTVTRPAEIGASLDALVEREAFGWKGRGGTAILRDPPHRAVLPRVRGGGGRPGLVADVFTRARRGTDCGRLRLFARRDRISDQDDIQRGARAVLARARPSRHDASGGDRAEGLASYGFLGASDRYKRAGLGASSSGADLGAAPTSRDRYRTFPTPGGLE